MKLSWRSLILPIYLFNPTVATSTPLQHCALNEVFKTDICFAVSTWKNSTRQQNDLSLHISARFPVEATGWAAVGIGQKMNQALMFVMYPGGVEGAITTSIRTTTYHEHPHIAEAAPETHVTRTWIEDDGLHNAQITCFGCESWSGIEFDVSSTSQNWIWAMNWKQQTHSDDVHLRLLGHTDRGMAQLNMPTSFITSPADETLAVVSTQRVSLEPALNSPGPAPVPQSSARPTSTTTAANTDKPMDEPPKKEHHKHSLFGIVSIHGFLLSLGFFTLSIGVLGIRSGTKNSYKVHWVIQASAGSAIVLGCLLGIYMSYKHKSNFSSTHQIIGLSILPTIILQSALGYMHHLNYVRYSSRTGVSYMHIWAGRGFLVIGNLNVYLGLNLSGAQSFKYYSYYIGLMIQLCLLIPMYYFYLGQQKTILEVMRGKSVKAEEVGYDSVEQEAFISGDEMDDLDDHDVDESDMKQKRADL